MAAGLGFKDFTTGEVLTAADVDGYLMQGVWVFASAAARDAAVTSPQEGNFAYLKDTNVTTYYTGSAWANLDTTGMTNPMTTTGDTIYSSSGSTPARLGIGSTGQVLTVAGGIPSWATPAGGGGGWTELASGSIAASATGFDLQTIDQTYRELVLVVNALSVSNGAGYNNGIRCNNDSGTNYSAVTMYPSAVQSNASQSSGIVGANEDTGTKHTLIVKITNYTDTTSPKLMVSQFNAFETSKPQFGMQFWHNSTPAAIDRLQLVSIGDTYDGGTYKLYGVK
jgi:hypothetical protein